MLDMNLEKEFEKFVESLASTGVEIVYCHSVYVPSNYITVVIYPSDEKTYGKLKAKLLFEIERNKWKFTVYVVKHNKDRLVYVFDEALYVIYVFNFGEWAWSTRL